MMDKLKEYLWYEFSHSTIPKYYKYFEQWYNQLTENQRLYLQAYAGGEKSPFVSSHVNT